MEYLTACYWQGEGKPSLLLHHFLYKGVNVCIAGLVEGASALAGGLHVWFLSFPWDKELKNLQKLTEHVRCDWMKLLQSCVPDGRTPYTLLLAVEDRMLLLNRGCSWFLVNKNYGFDRYRPMAGNFWGRIEPGAGILVGTKAFGEYLRNSPPNKCQILTNLSSREQAVLRMEELVKRSCVNEAGTIYVRL